MWSMQVPTQEAMVQPSQGRVLCPLSPASGDCCLPVSPCSFRQVLWLAVTGTHQLLMDPSSSGKSTELTEEVKAASKLHMGARAEVKQMA